MNITLAQFQIEAMRKLSVAMETTSKEIILKSPTGSGKTIILTHFMDEYIKGNSHTVFVWLTPGKGNLEEQSKEKMDRYIHNAQTKLLSDVMTSGFDDGDCCFINWEKLTKKGNNALKDSERTNFLEHIARALDDGIQFKIVVDESHQNDTIKADEIIQYFHTDKIIRCSATPQISRSATLVEVKEEDVIAEGLIKKMLIINENFEQEIRTDSQTNYLLERALEKQRLLRSAFLNLGKDINPLIVVQLPNNSDVLCDSVQKYFESKGINFENYQLAMWLSGNHENTEGISNNDAPSIAVIMKQAVATGWDCPRAHILVKLRDNMDETFEIQTIGRIRRMPEAKHYDNEDLDCCYLYTFDKKFTEGVKKHLGKNALNEKFISLKPEHKKIKLTKEQRTMVTDTRNPQRALFSIYKYLETKFSLTGDKGANKTKLAANGFEFNNEIVRYSYSGKVVKLHDLSETDRLNSIKVFEPINTHIHGNEHRHVIALVGLEIGIPYNYIHTILGKLFSDRFTYRNKLLALEPKEFYSFMINNGDLLRKLCREAMAAELSQQTFDMPQVSKKDFFFPQTCRFTYDADSRVQAVCDKNVYNGYLLSAEPRSSGEKKFEKFCERCDAVDWFYKNGDKGEEYLSVVYTDNSEAQKLFYPDYVLSVKGQIWIIETKGGFTRSGDSQDIDQFSAKKFTVLKDYLSRYNMKGGFVRFDAAIDELCICINNYSNDIQSTDWALLSEIIK